MHIIYGDYTMISSVKQSNIHYINNQVSHRNRLAFNGDGFLICVNISFTRLQRKAISVAP